MAGAETKNSLGRSENINVRATQKQKTLIDSAAEALGRGKSDFMLETALPRSRGSAAGPAVFCIAEA